MIIFAGLYVKWILFTQTTIIFPTDPRWPKVCSMGRVENVTGHFLCRHASVSNPHILTQNMIFLTSLTLYISTKPHLMSSVLAGSSQQKNMIIFPDILDDQKRGKWTASKMHTVFPTTKIATTSTGYGLRQACQFGRKKIERRKFKRSDSLCKKRGWLLMLYLYSSSRRS